MGQVYRATDTTLGRQVAIKILPDAFAADPERLARFEREAKTLASLNHPHIAAIYAVEKSTPATGSGQAAVWALVMELVEGEDLSQRIARGAIPLDEALPIAKQIAEALEAAHEQGIVHRDLKPANIKVRPDGTVKVLDFGLAKAMGPAEAGRHDPSVAQGFSPAGLSQSPTMLSPAHLRQGYGGQAQLSGVGVILGTAAYMSPEQARGAAVDKRADLWAFGVVLWEMLTGKRLFEGATVSDTLASVLKTEPDWTTLPADTPAPIRRLLRRCLDKDRKRRLDSAAAARLEIDEALTSPTDEARVGPADAGRHDRENPVSAWRRTLPWAVAAAALAAVAALAIPTVRHLREAPLPVPLETRTEIVTPATDQPGSFALSPDGRQIVFVASGDGASRLWLRSLATTTAQPLAATEGAVYPFWSPDSRSIAFFANGKLKRLDVGRGQPQALADATSGRGGTWNADGIILFEPTVVSPLFRMSAAGGKPTAVTTLGRHTGHRFPSFLPDGRHFLFYAEGASDVTGLYVGSLDSADTTRLTMASAGGVYVEPGWLFWVRVETLVAQRLDVARQVLAGDAVVVADSFNASGAGARGFSTSATGLVAYRARVTSARQLVWVDRSGKALGTLGAVDQEGNLVTPHLSPDGKRAAVFRTLHGNSDIWLLEGSSMTRFTFDPAQDRFPVWSPDGSRIVFDSTRTGTRNLYMKPSSGAGGEQLLLDSAETKVAQDWSADGRFLLYTSTGPQTGQDLWVLPMEGDRRPRVFLKTPFQENSGQFSPDGRFVAYVSNESGRYEVWVRPFVERPNPAATSDGAGARWQISTEGGLFPRWRPDSRELCYLDGTGQMMAVPVTLTSTTFEGSSPKALFRPRIVGGGVDTGPGRQYDVARDGRFLINTVLDEASAPITLLQNWNPAVKK